MPDRLISVVLPVYNQADHIAATVESYVTSLQHMPNPVEFLLVVNGCRDNSLAICNQLAEKYAAVRVICSQKGGWGLAVRLGLQAARGEWLCYTNSARTSQQDLMLLLLYAMANPNAIVKAHRRSRESLMRKMGSFLFNLECRALFDLPTWDINATPKVLTREIYNAIQPEVDSDLLDLEIYQKCKRLNVLILEVPTYTWTRHGGTSTMSFRSAWRLYLGAFKMWQALRKAHKAV